jgi:hypothetical protein
MKLLIFEFSVLLSLAAFFTILVYYAWDDLKSARRSLRMKRNIPSNNWMIYEAKKGVIRITARLVIFSMASAGFFLMLLKVIKQIVYL